MENSLKFLGIIFMIFLSGCSKSKPPEIIIETPFTNTLYAGIFQPIQLSSAFKTYQIEVVGGADVARLNQDEQGNYFNNPQRIGAITLKIKSGEMSWDKTLNVQYIPNLVGTLCNVYSGLIPKKLLVSCPGITVTSENYGININYKVESFDLFLVEEGKGKIYGSDSNSFSQAQINTLNKLGEGDRFYLENISVKSTLGTVREVPIMRFEIKD